MKLGCITAGCCACIATIRARLFLLDIMQTITMMVTNRAKPARHPTTIPMIVPILHTVLKVSLIQLLSEHVLEKDIHL